jgi:hypothetical protein
MCRPLKGYALPVGDEAPTEDEEQRSSQRREGPRQDCNLPRGRAIAAKEANEPATSEDAEMDAADRQAFPESLVGWARVYQFRTKNVRTRHPLTMRC